MNAQPTQHQTSLSTKLKVYKAVVLPSLLYGCTTDISRSRSTFTWGRLAPSFESAGKTASPICKNWNMPTPPVESILIKAHFNGWDMSSVWKSSGCEGDSCMENLHTVGEIKAAPSYGSKTLCKTIFSGATLNQKSWKNVSSVPVWRATSHEAASNLQRCSNPETDCCQRRAPQKKQSSQ